METYSVRLVGEMAKRASVDLIALSGRADGRAPSPLTLLRFALLTGLRLFTASEARVVHVGDLASWPFAWVAALRHPRSRVVISAHGSDVSVAQRGGWRSALYRGYLKLGSTLVGRAHIIANSAYVAALSRKAGFDRVSIVPLATDLHCEESNVRNGVLYAGRISRAKGLRFLIEEVLPLLPTGVRLRVAGTVWEESERELLSHPLVDYLGVLPPEQLAAEYARAGAVLIPTRASEGFGLVAIEAASCGAYVIASRHSGLADVVIPPIGETIAAEDAQAWAAAVEKVLATPEKDHAVRARQARQEVSRNYRWSRVADATWLIYGTT